MHFYPICCCSVIATLWHHVTANCLRLSKILHMAWLPPAREDLCICNLCELSQADAKNSLGALPFALIVYNLRRKISAQWCLPSPCSHSQAPHGQTYCTAWSCISEKTGSSCWGSEWCDLTFVSNKYSRLASCPISLTRPLRLPSTAMVRIAHQLRVFQTSPDPQGTCTHFSR